jgi:hypothetical protein
VTSKKLEAEFNRNSYKKEGVEAALVQIGNLMTDEKALLERYGIELTPKNAGEKVSQMVSLRTHYINKLMSWPFDSMTTNV